eukprot:1993526-Pleurochrysis_carterae.AAC.4
MRLQSWVSVHRRDTCHLSVSCEFKFNLLVINIILTCIYRSTGIWLYGYMLILPSQTLRVRLRIVYLFLFYPPRLLDSGLTNGRTRIMLTEILKEYSGSSFNHGHKDASQHESMNDTCHGTWASTCIKRKGVGKDPSFEQYAAWSILFPLALF